MHIAVSIHSFNPAFILKPKGNQKILGFFIQFIILSVSLTASYNWTIGVCVNKDTVLVVAHLADVTNSTVVRAAQNLPTCRRSRSFTCLPPVISPPIYFILIQAHILDGRHDISIKSGDSGDTESRSCECFVYTESWCQFRNVWEIALGDHYQHQHYRVIQIYLFI